MKKIVVTVVAVLLTVTAFAQFTTQGTLLLGGSSNLGLSFLSEKFKLSGGDFQDGDKITSFNISPQVGYFVIDNLAVGAGLDFNSTKFKNDNSQLTSSTITFGPFARYYFDKFYAEGNVGFGSSKSDSGNGEIKNTLSAWSIGGGYALLLSDAVAIEPQVGYLSSSTKDQSDGVNKHSGIFISLTLFVYLSK